MIGLAFSLVIVLVWKAWHAMQTTGLAFFTTSTWDPEPTHRLFGAKAFMYGTAVTSMIAMLVAVPLGVGTAAFLSELAPGWMRRSGSFFVEMLAAIPSVVYGFWGLYVFSPAVQRLISSFSGPDQVGTGLLPAGLVLGIMILPYASAVSFDMIRAVPRSQREAALVARDAVEADGEVDLDELKAQGVGGLVFTPDDFAPGESAAVPAAAWRKPCSHSVSASGVPLAAPGGRRPRQSPK